MFRFEGCKEARTPMKQKGKLSKEDEVEKVEEGYFRILIGCFEYLTATCPTISNAISILSIFMHCANQLHLKVAKKIIRYVKDTSDFGVKFTRNKEFKPTGFSNSNKRGSINDMKNTSGYCFTLRSSVFSWNSKKQEIVAQSITIEVEVIATTIIVKN